MLRHARPGTDRYHRGVARTPHGTASFGLVTSREELVTSEPIVAVVIPALNEAGKIGRVLDKMPRDGRFEAIVVDDGSDDGTGDEARAHGAAVVVRHERRQGVGAAIRDGWEEGLRRDRPYLALLSGDDQHEPAELVGALDALLARDADYVQGSRWISGGRVTGGSGGRNFGTRFYSLVFSVLTFRRITDATNGFRVFRAGLLRDPSIDLAPGLADELRPRAVRPVQGDPAALPGHRASRDRPIPCQGGLHEDAGPARLVAPVPPRPPAPNRGEAMTEAPERAFRGRRVLVTGGAGFVGGAVVRKLVDAGARVTVLDDLFTGQPEIVPASAQFVEGSVTDQALVRELVADASIVFHMAARNIIASTKNPRDDYETNIGGTLNVLMAARETKLERVVYTSSTSVYGNPQSIPINEDAVIVPLSPYAVSKLGGENYCVAFYESYGLPMACVRYSNVYGPGQRPDNPYCGVVAKFFEAAMTGRPLGIHGDGEQTRDFTYIDDAVDATLLAAIQPRAEGEVFNVGTGIETSVNDLARRVGQAIDKPVEIQYIDRRDIDNIRRRVVNIEKARRMLRWGPQVTLARGLARTAEWLEKEQRRTLEPTARAGRSSG